MNRQLIEQRKELIGRQIEYYEQNKEIISRDNRHEEADHSITYRGRILKVNLIYAVLYIHLTSVRRFNVIKGVWHATKTVTVIRVPQTVSTSVLCSVSACNDGKLLVCSIDIGLNAIIFPVGATLPPVPFQQMKLNDVLEMLLAYGNLL
jgi:hypothetical protein